MIYHSMEECVRHLEKNGLLVRIKEEVDPFLEMATIHLRVHEQGGPALLFENIKGCKYRAVSNLFGTLERSKFIFQSRFQAVQDLIQFRKNPLQILKNPLKAIQYAGFAAAAIPLKNPLFNKQFDEIRISDLPLIHHWPGDGGAFITLPQVYTEHPDQPGIFGSNLGMYRIQLTGNQYEINKTIGLHYQLHRGIGVHQTIAAQKKIPLKVSVFAGGPPAHTLAAVMPLPEGMSELSFAGLLGGRRFRYRYEDGYCISTDADFVVTGSVVDNEVLPEGPFGDHLGYYSLRHDFPVLRVHKVFARKNAIWPFTVVGRPPQEDTSFGALIHALTGNAIEQEIPGLKEVHAVDAAGVHPLLLAVGSERYTPYAPVQQPGEILTIANHILGTGQLSLAKFLFITAPFDGPVKASDTVLFFNYILQRVHWERDIHFYTNTTIDTLDYSGAGLNKGSKLVVAAYGPVIRSLCTELPVCLQDIILISYCALAMPGVVCVQTIPFTSYDNAAEEIERLSELLQTHKNELKDCPLIVLCDDAAFTAKSLNNFLWVSFTRSNPSHDIYGTESFVKHKHWGCKGTLILDARIKPHHAPVLETDKNVSKKIERLFVSGASLEGY